MCSLRHVSESVQEIQEREKEGRQGLEGSSGSRKFVSLTTTVANPEQFKGWQNTAMEAPGISKM